MQHLPLVVSFRGPRTNKKPKRPTWSDLKASLHSKTYEEPQPSPSTLVFTHLCLIDCSDCGSIRLNSGTARVLYRD